LIPSEGKQGGTAGCPNPDSHNECVIRQSHAQLQQLLRLLEAIRAKLLYNSARKSDRASASALRLFVADASSRLLRALDNRQLPRCQIHIGPTDRPHLSPTKAA